jgi:hypothetical protein
MTPEQHAIRAAELAAEAEQSYADVRAQVENGGNIDDPVWRYLDTTIQLGQLHATLALGKPVGPSFVPTYELLDPDPDSHRPG